MPKQGMLRLSSRVRTDHSKFVYIQIFDKRELEEKFPEYADKFDGLIVYALINSEGNPLWFSYTRHDAEKHARDDGLYMQSLN